jgi:hypothetical protein
MFPIEIWQKIFRYACVDGGRTGCALSLVSRRMHDISANIHLQSVFVVGLKRLQHLECTLRQLPEERRAVQALFIAARPDDAELHAWPTATVLGGLISLHLATPTPSHFSPPPALARD